MFQQSFKNFNINFNALNERNTFSSGDVITGHVSFDLTKETKITSITMTLAGKADIHWSTGGGKKSRRRNFSAKVEYFNLKDVIVQENNAIDRATRLRPGAHMYPFTCQLPQGSFPSTFKGVNGKIAYTLTVGINRPWRLSKDFVTELNFESSIDTNHPELQAPLSGSNQMTLCCLWYASRPITMTARVEKKAFTPGETVKIICEFSNGSSQTATPKVKLQQKQTYYTHNRVHKRMICRNLVSVTGQPIIAHAHDVHTEIMLTIPSTASPTIPNCSILVVDYLIEASLCGWALPDLTILFPIILSLAGCYHGNPTQWSGFATACDCDFCGGVTWRTLQYFSGCLYQAHLTREDLCQYIVFLFCNSFFFFFFLKMPLFVILANIISLF